MIKGRTESGFEFEFDEKKLQDMRFIRLMRKADENPLYMDDLVVKMLGEEQTEAFYKHLETKDGRVPPEAVGEGIVEIMNAAGDEIKNS